MKLSTDAVIPSEGVAVVIDADASGVTSFGHPVSTGGTNHVHFEPGRSASYRTPGAAGWTILTQSPRWGQPAKNISSQLLVQCYHSCLHEAEKRQCACVVFPVIGTGCGGFPVGRAVQLGVLAVREYAHDHPGSCIGQVVWSAGEPDVKAALDDEIRACMENAASAIITADIHEHIVWGVDDGPTDEQMSYGLLRLAAEQGIRRIVATSHGNVYTASQQSYNENLSRLIAYARQHYPEIKICKGTEIRVHSGEEPLVMRALQAGSLHYMGSTNKALIELSVHAPLAYNLDVVKNLMAAGQAVIVAHAERYHHFCEDIDAVEALVGMGCEIQVNAYSLAEEANPYIRRNAQTLAERRLIHFLGTDAHRTNHRPPSIQRGLQWLYANADAQWVQQISYGNALQFFSGK